MDVNVFYQTLDDLFMNKELDQVELFLTSSLAQAKEENDYQAYIAIGNEMIGYYRSVSEYEKAYQASEDVLLLMEELKLEDTEHFATVLLNSATAFRAGGRYKDAYEQYARAARIYGELLPPGDHRMAELYSDMSMLLEATGEDERAVSMAKEALSVIRVQEDAGVKEAVALTNLALVEMKCGSMQDAREHLLSAVSVFEAAGSDADAHYSGALAGLGELYFRDGEYEKSLEYYERACTKVKEQYGENRSYAILSGNCAAVCEQLGDAEKQQYYLERAAAAEGKA